MSANRRTILTGLAVLPLATAPVAMPFRTVAGVSPDAGLIACARRTVALSMMDERAVSLRGYAQEHFEALEPECPADCRAAVSASWRTIMDECPSHAENQTVDEFAQRAGIAAKAIKDQHDVAMAAYNAECARLRVETGYAKAERLTSYLDERLERAVLALVSMPAQTLPGVVAKAKALQAIQATSWGNCNVPWRDSLALGIARDLVTIGGAA